MAPPDPDAPFALRTYGDFWGSRDAVARPTTAKPDDRLFAYGVHEAQVSHFNVDEIDASIRQYGHPCEYRRAVRCPCALPDTRDSAAACPLCRPLGYLYPEALRTPDTRVLISGRNDRAVFQAAGLDMDGTVSVTMLRGVVPAYMDMIVLDGTPHVVHEVKTRAENPIDLRRLQRKITDDRMVLSAPRPAHERLLYTDPLGIDILAWKVRDDKVVVGVLGHDYVLRGNEIEFLDGRGPEPGHTYTVRYRAQASYVLPAEVTPRAEAGVLLPYKAQAIRLDRVMVGGQPTEGGR
jgi:hypothetical protein